MGGRVCVVDDDAGVRELLYALCESHGLSVKAYDSAEAFWNDPDRGAIRCLVLELILPGMSGIDLLDRLRRAGIQLPVIGMSGMADRAMLTDAAKLGVVAFFTKPFDVHHLLRRIEEICRPEVPLVGAGAG
jgi:two-component system response regulator FixJ